LKNMPVTELKIDRSFVMKLDSQEDDQIIVKSTIDLAHSFGLEIVAEGVENAAALQLLQQWGIDWVQGYFFSRPLPAGEVLPWVIQFTAGQVVSATR
ncbi:MAG TPA: EAL domain-containing protein, partial [Dongiaceae bacterium]|nr:EAL domain-containing protein [Dongiaceae bacterium]